ncbi:hypothetical protein Ddye_025427 [Dipteronia dyeriana]|uniref:Uncharacterized protein n=1 Tax=Dipteronia dyeriana TaxID=168575 RepID=A0AAD9TKU6_9ROSI|nr:hypothetical protein Ddye_025427 [Dipteronia dyeriana]
MLGGIPINHYLEEYDIMDMDKFLDRKYFDWRILDFCLRNKVDIEVWVDIGTNRNPNTKIGADKYQFGLQAATRLHEAGIASNRRLRFGLNGKKNGAPNNVSSQTKNYEIAPFISFWGDREIVPFEPFFHAFPGGLEKAAINRIFLILPSRKEERQILFPFPFRRDQGIGSSRVTAVPSLGTRGGRPTSSRSPTAAEVAVGYRPFVIRWEVALGGGRGGRKRRKCMEVEERKAVGGGGRVEDCGGSGGGGGLPEKKFLFFFYG